jgi:hypothetical protein
MEGRFLARQGRHLLVLTRQAAISMLDGKQTVKMTFAGTGGARSIEGTNALPGVSNYLDGKQRLADVPHFEQVLLRDVYPGTDLAYYFNSDGSLEYDFIVRPGAKPDQIQLQFSGAMPSVARDGSLILDTPAGQIRQHRPRAYQNIGGRKMEVPAKYKALGGARFAFEVAAYDRGTELIIDPPITYMTYMGGTGRDTVGGVKTDGAGNAYLFGQGTTGLPQLNAVSSTVGAFVTKFNAAGQLVYSTFLGFNNTAGAVSVNTAGEVHVAFERDASNASRVLKLNAAGSGFLYNTTATGATHLIPRSGAADASGNNYVCGAMLAGGVLPTTSSSLHPTSISVGSGLGYLMKFAPSGQVSYATHLPFECSKLAVDAAGNAFVNGGVSLPFTTWTATATFGSQPANETPFAEVIGKINAAGSALLYSIQMRSVSLRGLAVDPLSDALYIGANASSSVHVPTVNPLRASPGNQDGYIAKLNGTGTQFLWATFVGGGAREDFTGIGVDPVSGTVAFVADTTSTDITPVSANQSTSQRSSGCATGMVGQINPGGTALLFQSYYGATACLRTENGIHGHGYLATDSGAFYVAGEVLGSTFPLPVVNPAQANYGGGTVDTFLAKFGTTAVQSCNFTLGSTSINVAAAGGSPSVTVTTQAGCTYSATTSSSFISVASGSPGNGSGTVILNVAANAGAARSDTVLIAGQTFTVNQSAAAVSAPSIASVSPNPAVVGTSTFTITGTNFDPASARVEIDGGTIIANGSLTTKTATQLIFQATLSAGTHSFVVRNVTAALVSASVTVTATANPSTGSYFVPIAPCRAADTRSAGSGAIAGSTSRDFSFGACAIPANAVAVALNVTLVPNGSLGYLSIWPAGQPQPVVSTMNSLDGRIKANAAIVGVGSNQAVSIFVTNTAHVILDVNGYFVPSNTPGSLAFYPVTPCRVVDTRIAGAGGIVPALATRRIDASTGGNCLPASAHAYSLNVTTVPTGPLGFLTLWPDDGSARPLVSTLNNLTGTVVANAAILRAGNAGAFNAFVTDASHLIVDLNGYFAPPGQPGALAFYPVQPCRIFDTRTASGAFGGPTMAADQTRNFAVPSSTCNVPGTAQAYVTNATVVPPAPFGFLTMFPAGQPRPTVSTLNAIDGALTSNAAIVPAGTGGAISVYTSSATHLLLDISGYFAPLVVAQ